MGIPWFFFAPIFSHESHLSTSYFLFLFGSAVSAFFHFAMHWASTLAFVLCVHLAIVVPSRAQSMEWFTLNTPSSEYGDTNFFSSKEINFIVTENSDKRFGTLCFSLCHAILTLFRNFGRVLEGSVLANNTHPLAVHKRIQTRNRFLRFLHIRLLQICALFSRNQQVCVLNERRSFSSQA